jgi:guanylate kinase
MILLIGASASGKTEVAHVLASKYHIHKVITHTTRPMRINEKNGIDYHFVTPEQMQSLIQLNFFVETTLYNGNTYGTSKPEVSDDKVLIVDAQGFQSFMALKNPRIVTFLLEASETTRLNRMLYRGDQLEDAKKRIENDREQFDKQHLIKMDYVINSEAVSIEEVADKVFHYYQKHLIR